MKRWVRHISLPLLLMAVLLSVASCVGVNNLRQMNIRSGKIVNIQLPSFGGRTLTATVMLDLENPAGYVKASDISGVIRSKSQNQTLGTFTVDDFSIDARCDKEYLFRVYLTPDSGLSIFSIMALMNNFSPDDYVFDIDLRLSGSPSSKGSRFQLKNKPVGVLLKNIRR